MINEEATFAEFGYYSTDLSPKSNKKVIAICDDCGKIRESTKNIYHALCTSCAKKGERHPLFGKHRSEKTRKKMSDALKGESHPLFGKHHSEETKQKLREVRKHRRFPLHHTKPERIFEEICKKYNLPFKYTGDGSFWIGKKPSVNPDFVECNGKKLAVEIFGDYWHSPSQRYNICYSQTFKGRKEALKKYGWKLIVLWERDLKRADAETFVLNELRKEVI